MPDIDVTYKQYYISPIKCDLPDMIEISWKEVFVYVGKDLNYQILSDSKGKKYIVLGDVYTSSSEQSVFEELNIQDGSDLNAIIKNWTGRWLILSDDEIQTDACGLMQVFYGYDSQWFISSSLALISTMTHKTITTQVDEIGLTWQILPLTLIDDVKSLLCTQKIKYAKDAIAILPNLWVIDYSNLSTEDKVNKLVNNLIVSLKNIERFSGLQLWIALTAGKDSRLVLATAIKSSVNFQTYTAEHKNISDQDIILPGILANRYGFIHNYLEMQKKSLFRACEYLHFNGGNSKGADFEFYSNGQFEKIPNNVCVVRGGLFEAAQQFGRGVMREDIDLLLQDYMRYYSESFKNHRQKESLDIWAQWVKAHPINFIDIRDRFYIEQRVGGWAASIEQSLSINKWSSIQLANNREIISILLSANERERQDVALTINSIKILENSLLDFPINKRSLLDIMKWYLRKIFNHAEIRAYVKRKL